MATSIVTQLKNILAGRRDIDIGQLQLINLDLVRHGAGHRWDKLRTKIFDVSTHFIEKRISREDILIRCEEGYLLIFAGDDRQAAEAKTREISHAMNLFFLGEEIFKGLQITSLSRRLDLDNLARLLAAENVTLSEPAPASEEGPAPSRTEPQRTWLRRRIDDFRRDSEAVFVPVWDSRRQAVTTQFCTLKTLEHATGEILYGRLALRGHDEPRDHAAYDLAVCEAAAQAMRDAEARGRRVTTCVQVHLKTLGSRETRQQYFAALAAIPARLHDHVLIRVDGIGAGTPESTVQDAFQSLRPHAGYMLAKLPFGYCDMSLFRGLGVAMYGWDCPAGPRDFRFSDTQVAALARLAHDSRAQGAAAYLSRPASWEASRQALDAGVRFLAGPRVVPATKLPLAPFRLETEDIRRRNDTLVLS